MTDHRQPGTVVPTKVPEEVPVIANADGSTRTAVVVDPTQVRRPWRTALRTFVQTLVPAVLALGLVVPEVVRIVLDEAGDTMPDQLRAILLGVSAAVATTAAVVARIMAIPAVEQLLRRFKLTSWLAAAPSDQS